MPVCVYACARLESIPEGNFHSQLFHWMPMQINIHPCKISVVISDFHWKLENHWFIKKIIQTLLISVSSRTSSEFNINSKIQFSKSPFGCVVMERKNKWATMCYDMYTLFECRNCYTVDVRRYGGTADGKFLNGFFSMSFVS